MGIFHTHFVLPLAEPEGHVGLARRLRQMRNFETLPHGQQRAVQHQRLQRLLTHAYETVPFYRKQFDDAGVHPSQIGVGKPLPIPVTTRDTVSDQSLSRVSTAFTVEDLAVAASSGPTSTPIASRQDIEGLRDKVALNLHLNSWADYHPGDSVMMLWGADRDLAYRPGWRWRLYEEVLMRRTSAASGLITDEILERFRLLYEKQRPKVLHGSSTVIAALATFLETHGVRHRPQVVIATGEALSDNNRRKIESVFNTRPYIHYGSRDIGIVAAECSDHEGLHFHPWGTYVEFDPIGETPDGPAYRLLATDLLNYGRPSIRYDTGDCVTLTEQMCSCGRWFPLVRSVLGRMTDGIALADGGRVPGATVGSQMTDLCQDLRAVSRAQPVQKSQQHLHLRYVVKAKESNLAESQDLTSISNGGDALSATGRTGRWRR
ncbi:MAG: phenylacetate--CoA ligase family protein [Acidobacteriaceae bacterium]